MTIQRAREILGDDIADLSDEEVASLNNETSLFCSNYLTFMLKHPVENLSLTYKNTTV